MRLAANALTPTTNVSVYTVPANRRAAFTLSLCNRGTAQRVVRVALSTSASPANGDFIEYNATLPAYGVLERSGLVLGAGQILICWADGADVSAVVFGVEEQV